MLVEDKERLGPMRQGELEYAYYDSSARPAYVVYRQLKDRISECRVH